MSYRSSIALGLLLAVGICPAFGEVPDQAWGTSSFGQEAPMWVSEDIAVVDGQLQSHRFHPQLLERVHHSIERFRPANSDGCTNYQQIHSEEGRVKGGTPAAVIANSAQVESGVIRNIKQGFVYGQPASLVEVALDRKLPGTSFKTLFLVFRVADIPVEGTHLCADLPAERAVPQVGADIVLAMDEPLGDQRFIGRVDDGAPIIELGLNETLVSGSLPPGYRQYELRVPAIRGLLKGRSGEQ